MTDGGDVSNLQRPLTVGDIQTMRARNGLSFLWIGCQYPGAPYPPGDAHIDFASIAAAFTDTGTRAAPYFENTPVEIAWPHIAAHMGQPYFVPMAMLAVEQGGGFTDEATIDAQVAATEAVGLEVVFYTSAAEWEACGLNGVTKYGERGYKLVIADYDDVPAINVAVDFGGWTVAWGKQYTEKGDAGIGYPIDFDRLPDLAPLVNAAPAAPEQPAPEPENDEDSLADRILVEGSPDNAILNAVAAKALGPLMAGNQADGVQAFVRYGPSVDLPAGEEEFILRVPAGTIPRLEDTPVAGV